VQEKKTKKTHKRSLLKGAGINMNRDNKHKKTVISTRSFHGGKGHGKKEKKLRKSCFHVFQ
jgi:hypothetical protein